MVNRVTPAEALARLPGPGSQRFAEVFSHGSLTVEIYAPQLVDPQSPHSRDEVYVIVSGSGSFVIGEQRLTFNPGDFLFVPAGAVHRFEDFGPDFATWVFFYGPEGGEKQDESGSV